MRHNDKRDHDPGRLLRHDHEQTDAFVNSEASSCSWTFETAFVLLVLAAGSFIASFVGPVITFTNTGIAGYAQNLPISTIPATRPLTLLGIFTGLPENTDAKFVAWLIALTYLFLVIILPIIYFGVTAAVWVEAWRREYHVQVPVWCVRLRQISPYLYAWCSQDVLWMAAFAGFLEMNMPTQWIVENVSQGLCDKLANYSQGRYTCVTITGVLGPASYTLIFSAAATLALFVFTTYHVGIPCIDRHALL